MICNSKKNLFFLEWKFKEPELSFQYQARKIRGLVPGEKMNNFS